MYGNILAKIPSKISIFDSPQKWVPFLKTLEKKGWVDFFWVGEEDIGWGPEPKRTFFVFFSPLFFVNEIGPTGIVQLVLFMGI